MTAARYWLTWIAFGLLYLGCAFWRAHAVKCAHECANIFGVIEGETISCHSKCFGYSCWDDTCVVPPGHPWKDGFPVQRQK
jgi:hypothetical protein